MCVQDPNPSLQNRRNFFCVFQSNRGKREASAKCKSRARRGAQKDQRVPALAPDLRFVLAFHLSLVARETQQITPVLHVTKSQTSVKDYNKSQGALVYVRFPPLFRVRSSLLPKKRQRRGGVRAHIPEQRLVIEPTLGNSKLRSLVVFNFREP